MFARLVLLFDCCLRLWFGFCVMVELACLWCGFGFWFLIIVLMISLLGVSVIVNCFLLVCFVFDC